MKEHFVHLDCVNQRLLEQVIKWLQTYFYRCKPAKEVQLFELVSNVSAPPSALVDGSAGSALLSEIRFMIIEDSPKDVFKTLLFVATCALRFVYGSEGTRLRVCLAPYRKFPVEHDNSISSFRQIIALPIDVINKILLFAGPLWWSRHKILKLPLNTKDAFSITPGKVKKCLKKIMCFDCTEISIVNGRRIFAEWAHDDQVLWVRTNSISDLVRLIRCERRGSPTHIMHIGGFGDVYV
jgi:hypothetical protein